MNEHYTETGVNTDDLETYIFEGERRKRDLFIALLFIFIGVSGLYFITQASSESDNPQMMHNPIYKQEAQVMHAGSSPTSSPSTIHKASIVPTKKRTPKSQLKIKGNMEAHEAISFTIDSYDQNATYALKLGNGVTKIVDRKTFEYTYPQSGSYQVELDVTFEGETQKLAKQKIQIMEAIAVAPSASQIDF